MTSFIFSYIKQCRQIFFKTEWGSWWGILELQDLAYFYFLLLSFHMRMQLSVRCTFNNCKICFIYHFMFIAFFSLPNIFKQATGKSILKVFFPVLIMPQHSYTDTEWLFSDFTNRSLTSAQTPIGKSFTHLHWLFKCVCLW